LLPKQRNNYLLAKLARKVVAMSDDGVFKGADRMPAGERKRVAEAAWKQSGGSMTAFEQLCAEHMRGEINLFGETPTAIGGDGARATEARPPGIVPGIGGPQAMAGNEHGSAAGPVADAVEAERKAREAADADQASRTATAEASAGEPAAERRGPGRPRSEG
jgi:hypothetical protein